MKPFSRKNLNEEQAIFNYRLSRAHRIVENAFGILASRFRILLREINLSPEKATLIVQECTHLHNFLRMKKIELTTKEVLTLKTQRQAISKTPTGNHKEHYFVYNNSPAETFLYLQKKYVLTFHAILIVNKELSSGKIILDNSK